MTEASELSVEVHWQDEQTSLPYTKQVQHTFGALLAGEPTRLLRGRAIYEYAIALQSSSTEAAFAALAAAEAAYPGDAELAEIRAVLEAL